MKPRATRGGVDDDDDDLVSMQCRCVIRPVRGPPASQALVSRYRYMENDGRGRGEKRFQPRTRDDPPHVRTYLPRLRMRAGTPICRPTPRRSLASRPPIGCQLGKRGGRRRRQGTTERAESDAAVRDEGERTCHHIATSTEHLTISSANP